MSESSPNRNSIVITAKAQICLPQYTVDSMMQQVGAESERSPNKVRNSSEEKFDCEHSKGAIILDAMHS